MSQEASHGRWPLRPHLVLPRAGPANAHEEADYDRKFLKRNGVSRVHHGLVGLRKSFDVPQ